MTKATIRDQMRQRRAAVDTEMRREASAAIVAAILARPECRDAACLACFLSLPQEIDTAALIAVCRAAGRQVCVPAWNPEHRAYELVALAPGAPLVPGPLGILEPAVRQAVATASIGFAVVPGLAFDRRGGRIGYGGGHFDRLLAASPPTCIKAGAAYAWQVVADDLPLTAHDVRMDLVFTEHEVIEIW